MAPRKTNNSKKGTCAAEVHNMSVGASNNTGTIANRNSNDIDTNRNSNEGHVDRFMSIYIYIYIYTYIYIYIYILARSPTIHRGLECASVFELIT